jgi:hypothetical protein
LAKTLKGKNWKQKVVANDEKLTTQNINSIKQFILIELLKNQQIFQ